MAPVPETINYSRIDLTTTGPGMKSPQILSDATMVEHGLVNIVMKPIIQYTTSQMTAAETPIGKEWCEPTNGRDPTTYPKATCRLIMELPPVLLHQNPTLTQRPHNPDLFCLVLCIAHNFMANVHLPVGVENAKNWKRVSLRLRNERFIPKFLALLCIQYATDWAGGQSIHDMVNSDARGHMAVRMASEFARRFNNYLPEYQGRYSVTLDSLMTAEMKGFMDHQKRQIKVRSIGSVNYAHGVSTSTVDWEKHVASAIPFAHAYFLRQVIPGYAERCNMYEEKLYLTTEEKRMLRNQPVYCD